MASARSGSAEVAVVQSIYPPAGFVREFEQMLPGSAERFLRIVEREQEHDHGHEDAEARRDYRLRLVGLCGGAVLCLVAMLGGFLLILRGHPASGWVSLVSALAVVVGSIVGGGRR